MPVSRLGTLTAFVVLGALGYVGARATGPLPALGPFLDPANGIWATARSAELPKLATATIPGLSAETRVVYDDRNVPHIFAPTLADAYRALGFVVARDRLFQMEMQARAGAGTLTELVGSVALTLDRQTRELGMPRSAELRLQHTDTTMEAWKLVQAYTAGANAWIDALSAGDLPFEYKLLGRRPARWSPLLMLNLQTRMGWTLASSSDELTRLKVSARVGRAAADALFPAHAPIVEPIQPNGVHAPRFDSLALPTPGAPDTTAIALLQQFGAQGVQSLLAMSAVRGADAVGSNNWAVAPQRSASGHALLAGDPHLELTLPSIWYEVHLVVPGALDVYGVTIPGAPGVVIGFNRDVAWTFTNVGADVADYYLEQVNDPRTPTEYRLDGAWKPLEIRVERFLGPTGVVIGTDTVRYTHRGPMRRVGDRWVSMRWTVLESERDFEGFERASRATGADSLLAAMADVYHAPAQNMLAADRGGTIAIRSTGRYPLRPGDGRGDVLRDGSTSGSDWTGDWPIRDYPQAFRPEQGFLVSANQEPVDPRVQPRYLGSNWERPWRAMRINELLRGDSAVTPDAMRQFQSDPGSARADLFVAAFLAAADSVTSDDKLQRARTLLADWDRRYTRDNQRAVLFESAMQILSERLWDELRIDSTSTAPTPSDMMTASLLSQPQSPWWDDHRTSAVESRDQLLAECLKAALDSVVQKYGEPEAGGWRWDHIRFANINHLLRIPALSRLNVSVQGGGATIWPSTGTGTHGPSWRMVVELGSQVKAWSVYPGGQSGNPVSDRYDDRVSKWSNGELEPVHLPNKADDLPAAAQRAQLVLTPGR